MKWRATVNARIPGVSDSHPFGRTNRPCPQTVLRENSSLSVGIQFFCSSGLWLQPDAPEETQVVLYATGPGNGLGRHAESPPLLV